MPFTYQSGTQTLAEVVEYKYLGVTLTNDLSWNKHISNICASSFRKLGLLRHKLKHAPSTVKKLTYLTVIRPSLEYASIVWDPYTKRNIEALELIQRKAVRFIYSKYRRTDSPTNLMKENSIPTLEKRRKIHRLKFLFLLNNNKLSVNRDLYLKPLTTRQTRHRQTHSLTPYFARTNIFKYSFFPRTINDWNCLPQSLTSSVEALERI